MRHPSDYDTANLLRQWLVQFHTGDPADEITNKAIQELKAFKKRANALAKTSQRWR